SVVTVTGKPSSGRAQILAPRLRWPLLALTLMISGLVALLYLAILAGAFTRLLGIDNSPTLDNFRFVLFGIGSRAMTDTTFLSAVAAPIAAVLGLLVAYLVVRARLVGRALFDYVTMLGAAAPGIVLGLGILLAFNRPPLLLTGTALVFVMAFVVRTAPVALRSSVAA